MDRQELIHKAQAQARALLDLAKRGPVKLLLIIGGGIVALAVLAIIAINLLISADAVRDRVAQRIKEQTGRDLTVNGTTSLLFTPGPHIVITDASFNDPEARAGTADISVARLVVDLNFGDLLSRQVDAERVVVERPIVTVRLGSEEQPIEIEKPKAPDAGKVASTEEQPKRDMRLNDLRIDDGTVNIVYDEQGTEKRVEHINATVKIPGLVDPATGSGKFDWKGETVNFSFELTSPADLKQKRPAKLLLAVDTQAIAARFDGTVMTKPDFAGQGQLSAKAHSIPSLIAWMRERPSSLTAIGDGELASHVAWKKDEITLSQVRFALEHASGQGQAVVTLEKPRPHIRAAFAFDHLDLNPFLANPAGQRGSKSKAVAPRPGTNDVPSSQSAGPKKDWFSKPDADQATGTAEPDAQQSVPSEADAQPAAPAPQAEDGAAVPPQTSAIAAAPAAAARPAKFDADVNVNVRQTRVGHLELGPSSLGIAFRDGVLNATLGGMELYDGHASGKITLDASKEIPAFNCNLLLDGVQAKTLLSDAAQFSLLSGHTKLALQISGSGGNSDEIKSSLTGQGNFAVSDGAIEGINITELINSVGAGQIPDMRQGPGAKTTFSDLGGSFTIANGVAQTNTLKMASPVLNVTAEGSVDLTQSTIDMLARPEVVAGPEGKRGANNLAGLSVPVRIEGPLAKPSIRPEVKAMFADPEQAGKTVNQIGEALQKKFKGKPVGEAIGRFLGNVQIGPRNRDAQGDEAPPRQKQSGKNAQQPTPDEGAADQESGDDAPDPDLDRILR
jgi:AsmA protein